MRFKIVLPFFGLLAGCSGAIATEVRNTKDRLTSVTEPEEASTNASATQTSPIPLSNEVSSEVAKKADESPSALADAAVKPKVAKGVIFLGATSVSDGSSASWRKLSNIMSIFAGRDPYFNNLPVGTLLTKTGWQYTRDPAKTISLTITLRAFERQVEGTDRNRWWQIVSQKVASSTGSWSPGDVFAKSSRDGYGDQWFFNYRVTDTD